MHLQVQGLVINNGEGGGAGLQHRGGSGVLISLRKGGGQSFSHTKVGGRGHKRFWGSFNTGA